MEVTPLFLTTILLMAPILSVSGLDDEEQAAKNTAATMAVQEMKRAYYFTFVTLINMVKDEMASNSTFLMPNDRMLSNVSVSQNKVMEFISMHSIPSLLMFEDLMHLPSGTVLPTNHPNFTITISNGGRKKFYLDEVQLNSPNICSTGSSFYCHGIDGVLKVKVARNATGTPPPCVRESSAPGPSPSPTPQQPAVHMGPLDMGPAISPIPADSSLGSRISDFTKMIFSTMLLSCIMLFQV